MNESEFIVCRHCLALNRVPVDKMNENGRCGSCKQALFTATPMNLDSASFNRQLQKSSVLLLVDFWASWCGPCKMMAPMFAAAAKQLEPWVMLGKVDTEAEQSLAARYSIRSIPTMILFKGGRELARQSGAMDQGKIVSWVKGYL